MKKRTQRIVVIILAVVMVLSILLPAVSMLAGASSSTKNEISNLKNQISSTKSELKEAESKLKEIKNQKSQAMQQKVLLAQQISLLTEEITLTESMIAEYTAMIETKEAEIAQLEEDEAQQYDLFCRQVRDMEETGSVSYLSILFSASSFSELLDYAMLIAEVMEYHNGVIDILVDTQDQKAEVKTELEGIRSEQEGILAELESDKTELQSKESELASLLLQIEAQEDEAQAVVDKFEEASKTLDKQLAAAEKKYEEELAALAVSGDWYWPLPGRYGISSWFKWRKHPTTGKWSHHTGNDIPAPAGTEIHSANAGVVTEVGYSNVYGNYIQVSHGNGYATFYAHMKSKAIVKEGATVTRGQVLGYVGTTGWSTGNHLHFELRINGERKDALELYPNLNFYDT